MSKEQVEAHLTALAQKKAKLEEELADVEKQVYNLETSYLNESSTHGNVLRGFEGYLATAKSARRERTHQRNFKTEDRLFSLSSTSSPAARALAQKRVEQLAQEKAEERAAPTAAARSHKAARI